MAKILPIHPVQWVDLKHHWWLFILIGVLSICIAIGSLYVIWSLGWRIHEYYKSRPPQDTLSSEISHRLARLSSRHLNLTRSIPGRFKPASFGVYLGAFDTPLSESQKRLIDQWDLLIIDPVQDGVAEAISTHCNTRVLGRLDLANLPAQYSDSAVIDRIETILAERFYDSAISGILLAHWEDGISPSVQKRLFEILNSLQLAVYLETESPSFLKNRHTLQIPAVSGLVIRNASILPDGERRDYFQMANLQSAIKACLSEACTRDFVVLAWETLNQDATISNATLRRSFQWCNFYNILLWIGTERALFDSSLNVPPAEPISAFGWLKEERIMKAHESWRSVSKLAPVTDLKAEWQSLQPLFPSLEEFLASAGDQLEVSEAGVTTIEDPPKSALHQRPEGHPLSVSSDGAEYNDLGCFPLGTEPSEVAFLDVLQSQQRLRDLGLLHPVPDFQVQEAGALLERFHSTLLCDHKAATAVKDLSRLMLGGALHVYISLHSGLRSNGGQFWAVHQLQAHGDIFVSKNADDLVGVIIHTFLSAKGLPRHVCFEVEVALAKWTGSHNPSTGLSRRLAEDIDALSPQEALSFIRQLSPTSAKDEMLSNMHARLRHNLIDVPSLTQLRELDTVGYLGEAIYPMELIEKRIAWYDTQKSTRPSFEKSIHLFHEVDRVFNKVLREHREDDLVDVSQGLSDLLQENPINAHVDMIALALFCAARKTAFEEIYAEVLDRNPLLNNQPDQAAVFAESFALGSRCEAYFGVSPSTFGKLISDRFRAYYGVHQPPSWINGAPEMATAFAGAQIDVNPDEKARPMRSYQRFTFMSVFAIPALIDIILLSIVGRGFYLSAYMTTEEQSSATLALMISLLISGAVGTWIAIGGHYYLISMAFSAVNMFVLTRLFAGIAVTVAGGLIGFVAIAATQGPWPGIVFYLYLISLTIYFSTFAALATFSYPGSAFLSGRKAIILCIPLLFLAPIIATFTGHDSAVYLAVMYVFSGALLLCLRRTISRWMTWYQSIRRTDDAEIRKWYISVHGKDASSLANISDPGVLKLAREALRRDVEKERSRSIFSQPTDDSLVKKLARDWESTKFLLNWYAQYADIPRPIPFSSSWNIHTKVALDTLQSSQKGLRLHNAFVHWRQSSNEIGCGILYFVLALLDKWIQLLCGDHLVGLAGAVTDANRKAVGFSLAYYLIGAVLIDTKAQELHEILGSQEPAAIKTDQDIRVQEKRYVRFRRKVYWRTLLRFLLWHVWSLAVSTALLLAFQSTGRDVIMFFAYVAAYTGLIWYQYTKIYAGPYALKPVLVGICIGLPVGIALKVCLPRFLYSQVVGLGIASWTTALLSLWNAGMVMPSKSVSPLKLGRTFHAFTAPWVDSEWSQHELQGYFDGVFMSNENRMGIHPSTQSALDIKAVLGSCADDPGTEAAFPTSKEMATNVVSMWDKGELHVELVPYGSLGPGTRALSCRTDEQLILMIGVSGSQNQLANISVHCNMIADILLRAFTEAVMEIPREYALWFGSIISEGMSPIMITDLHTEADVSTVTRWAKKELLRSICLGFDPDIQWDKLPGDIRECLLERCLGHQTDLSETQRKWLEKKLCESQKFDLDTHVARCNLGATAALRVLDHLNHSEDATLTTPSESVEIIPYIPRRHPLPLSSLISPFSLVYHKLGLTLKFLVFAFLADAEFHRELAHVIKPLPTLIRVPISFLLSIIWNYCKIAQDFGLSLFLFYGREQIRKLWHETKAVTVHIKRDRIIIQNLEGTFTAFRHQDSGGLKVFQYAGNHVIEPKERQKLTCVSLYSNDMLLLARQEFKDGDMINEYHYDHRQPTKKGFKFRKSTDRRVPLGRRCVKGDKYLLSIRYNPQGLVETGSYIKDGNLIRFKYHYRKGTKFGDGLLRAEFVMPHISCAVAWCAPPRRHPEKADRWIPHSKVTEATFVQGADVFESRWTYDHRFHPTIVTTLNGKKVKTPPMIENDFLGVLSKPSHTSFIHDDPFLNCDTLYSNVFTRLFGLAEKRFVVSTSRARSSIWKAWKNRMDVDGITARWMDDRLLRRDNVLSPYWRSRDWGHLTAARGFVDLHADAIAASADLEDDVSGWTPLAVKLSDLFNFGPGGDAVLTTRSQDVSDTEEMLHVMAADTGTWPNEGGGVSACRRDMVNSLQTVKWHMLCESANDFGIPKHQTERNIQSLKVIPLWGLDFLTPIHGLLRNKLDAEVDISTTASELDIKINFIPILTALVKGARTVALSSADIQQATRALVNLNTYFQEPRHWSQVWTSEFVKQAWRDLWLSQEMPGAVPSSQWLDTELSTLTSLNVALELWYRYLFIFSIPVPEMIPDVFQASHHSVSASYGVVCKIKRNCTLQIWDHAISWRETNLCLSSALSKLSPFVRNALLGLMRITSVLTLHHADVILPCADFFNPSWETEIGTCQGTLQHRKIFRRKIDPVVNGITDMQKFTPVTTIKSQRPTVTMLSHVWYAKDIKTALLAADIIINKWNFTDYHLDIYGAIDKAPTYSTECQEVIASKGLRDKVTLRGTADPMKVLEQTWLFLNSSLSEGLPLALGEAALTGAPVVATDVGASLRVLSDPDDSSRFSAIVAPNDALSLARAQISMLAMLGEWAQYADDSQPVPTLPSSPTTQDVEIITRRMYEKSPQRRELGMRARQIVQRSFSGDRYLREHEQMLWVGKFAKPMTRNHKTEVDTSSPNQGVHVPPNAARSWPSSLTTLLPGPGTAPGRSSMLSSSGGEARGMRREELVQYWNPDISLIVSQDVLRSGMLWSG